MARLYTVTCTCFQVQINRSLGLSIGARFMLMHIVATNVVVWISVIVEETTVEIRNSHRVTEEEGGNATAGGDSYAFRRLSECCPLVDMGGVRACV